MREIKDIKQTDKNVPVCVREAAFSFQSVFFMQSFEFIKMIEKKRELSESLDLLTDELVNELFSSINTEKNEKNRQFLISLKRKIFNRRLVAEADIAKISDIPDSKFKTYNDALLEKNNIFETCQPKIYGEIEAVCRKSLENDIFLASLRYSCPELSLSNVSLEVKFSKWLRTVSTIYAYALKHITKTPPLFTFSRVYLSDSKGEIEENSFETVLNAEVYSELENALVNTEQAQPFLKYEIAVNWKSGDKYYFLVFRDNTVRIMLYPVNNLLEKTVAFFNEILSENSFVNSAQVNELYSENEAVPGFELFEKLKKDGIISTFLIEDIRFPAESLMRSDAERKDDYAVLKNSDGKIFQSNEILSETRKITSKISTLGVKTSPPYIGYFYAGNITGEQKKTADFFAADLKNISDLFRPDNNNSNTRAAITGVIEQCFESSGKKKIPYLELITRVILLKAEINSKNLTEYKTNFDQFLAFQEKALQLKGNLSDESIGRLIGLLPEKEKQTAGSDRNFSMCFVGAVDFQTPQFYVHNVFSGDERFIGKYLTKRNHNFFDHDEDSSDDVNVEVLPNWNIPQHRVNRSLSVGFSFDRRTRRLFETTINPEDIDVILEKTPVFIHRPSGKKIKFHYRGLSLLQRIPIPYKILLFDQIDTFINVFAQTPPQCGTDQMLIYDELVYRSINLRRKSFCAGINLIKNFVLEKNWIHGAYSFREFIRENSGFQTDYIYFRPVANNLFTDTPRFLNIGHPLSWDIFRRNILKSSENTHVHFTECQPAPQQMFEKDDGNHFTEFMIEI